MSIIFWFYLALSILYLIRFFLSLIIAVDIGFKEDVVMVSIFSLLCAIITFIAFMFAIAAYSYNNNVYVSTKDYTYEYKIDITKEDYRDTRVRLNKQKIHFNRYIKISYISFIFAIGAIEETFRSDMLNKTYHDKYGVEYDYDKTECVLYTIEAIVEFILTILHKCIEYFNKKNKIL